MFHCNLCVSKNSKRFEVYCQNCCTVVSVILATKYFLFLIHFYPTLERLFLNYYLKPRWKSEIFNNFCYNLRTSSVFSFTISHTDVANKLISVDLWYPLIKNTFDKFLWIICTESYLLGKYFWSIISFAFNKYQIGKSDHSRRHKVIYFTNLFFQAGLQACKLSYK